VVSKVLRMLCSNRQQLCLFVWCSRRLVFKRLAPECAHLHYVSWAVCHGRPPRAQCEPCTHFLLLV
jgi:hypothetical protein